MTTDPSKAAHTPPPPLPGGPAGTDPPRGATGPDEYHGCAIPPDVHALIFGWDPAPEIERLLFLARTQQRMPRTALELGCGSGRLLRPLAERGLTVVGLELSPGLAAFAAARSGCRVLTGDMTRLGDATPGLRGGGGGPATESLFPGHAANAQFDLIYTSANTLRHVVDDADLDRFWRGVRAHLTPAGLFIADLELGRAYVAAQVGKPHGWTVEQAGLSGHGAWEVRTPPDPRTGRVAIEWRFEQRVLTPDSAAPAPPRRWRERFELRTDEAPDFAARAAAAGMKLVEMYEDRTPYLEPRAPEKMAGRALTVFERDDSAT